MACLPNDHMSDLFEKVPCLMTSGAAHLRGISDAEALRSVVNTDNEESASFTQFLSPTRQFRAACKINKRKQQNPMTKN